jgi:hypothetical protein
MPERLPWLLLHVIIWSASESSESLLRLQQDVASKPWEIRRHRSHEVATARRAAPPANLNQPAIMRYSFIA